MTKCNNCKEVKKILEYKFKNNDILLIPLIQNLNRCYECRRIEILNRTIKKQKQEDCYQLINPFTINYKENTSSEKYRILYKYD